MASLTPVEAQAIQAIIQPFASKRYRCWKGLMELLKTITAARGYSRSVVSVDSDAKDWAQVDTPNTPRLEVFLDEQTRVTHAGCVREYTYTFMIYGYTKGLTLEQFELFLADVETCVNDNNSLFGQANKMEVPYVLTDQQFFPRIDKSRSFAMTIQVEATRNARVAT